jgi:hypothetical protein
MSRVKLSLRGVIANEYFSRCERDGPTSASVFLASLLTRIGSDVRASVIGNVLVLTRSSEQADLPPARNPY